jgi:hypothetical protein
MLLLVTAHQVYANSIHAAFEDSLGRGYVTNILAGTEFDEPIFVV